MCSDSTFKFYKCVQIQHIVCVIQTTEQMADIVDASLLTVN